MSVMYKVANRYDITYQKKIFNVHIRHYGTVITKYENVMYCRQTEHYYIFWTGSEYLRLKKSLIINVVER